MLQVAAAGRAVCHSEEWRRGRHQDDERVKGTPADKRKPLVWIKTGTRWRIDWSKLR